MYTGNLYQRKSQNQNNSNFTETFNHLRYSPARECLAQSFAKNFGLYGERIGCLSFITQNEHEANAIKSQIQIICRNEYSNPPKFGAYLVDLISKVMIYC